MSTPATLSAALAKSGIVSVEPEPEPNDMVLLRLRLQYFDATAKVRAYNNQTVVHFGGELPSGAGRASLRHQGALSVVGQLREQKLGIDVVDAAFLVECDDDGFALLTRCADQLRALVPDGRSAPDCTLEVHSSLLTLCWPADDVTALPALWERLVALRSGA